MTLAVFGAPLKFLVVGVANTLVGLAVIYLCKWLFVFGDVLANVCGYAVGLAVSFALNRNWTFRHRGRVNQALVRFLAVFVVAYVCNLVVVLALIRHWGVNAYLAQALGIVPYTLVSYLGSRYFAFKA